MICQAGSDNFRKIVGSEIDLLNILWIYRVKKYYNFEEEKIKNILINRNYKITDKIKEKLIQAKDYDEMIIILKDTIYKNVFTDENTLEQNVDRYLYKINKKIFKQDIYSMAYIYAYINLIDYENNDIINTLEGIRYNMSKEEIINRLVR